MAIIKDLAQNANSQQSCMAIFSCPYLMSLENTPDLVDILEDLNINDGNGIIKNMNSPYCNELADLKTLGHNNHKYHALHLNIQSLPAKFDKLQDLICSLGEIGIELDFILLCETFVPNNLSQQFKIPNYNMVFRNRENKPRGGVLIYIHKRYQFKELDDASVFVQGEFESIFAEVEHNREKLIVGEIYRIPNTNTNISLARYESVIQQLSSYKHPIIIGTDQNFNFMKLDVHGKTKELFNHFTTNGLIPTITKPTRITYNSATLIDNLYIPLNELNQAKSAILINDMSDHLPIIVSIRLGTKSSKTKQTFTFRPINSLTEGRIRDKLSNINWSNLDHMTANEAYQSFSTIIQNTLNSEAPLKTITLTDKFSNREPWYTKGMQKSSNTLQKLYRKKLDKPNDQARIIKYTNYRNLFNKIKRIAKRTHFEKQLDKYQNDIKKTWQTLQKLISRENDKSNMTEYIMHNNNKVDNPIDIANIFLQHFSQIGAKLADKIKLPNKQATEFLTQPAQHNVFLSPTDEFEILRVIDKLKNKTSHAHDGISCKLLKSIKYEICQPLSLLINKSLLEGIVPDELKVAKVIPIYKAKGKENIDNYRPISILPSISKIYEKIVFKRLYHYLNHFDLIYNGQYGFRPNHSTTDAMTEFINHICNAFENHEYSAGVFLDLSKAFDTIDHDLLLRKLNHYGVRGKALEWFSSYLNNRRIRVNYNGHDSTTDTAITHGVPQGSILGPLLFIIYINDLPYALKKCKAILFADDTNMFHSAKLINTLCKEINLDLNTLSEWLRANKLSINLSKTICMIYSKSNSKVQPKMEIKMDELIISIKTSTKFLGVTIDKALNWHEHIMNIRSKLNTALFILNRVKHLLTKKYLTKLYYSLVHPHLQYGISIWGGSHLTYINKLVTLQKKAIRIINKVPYNYHTNNLFLTNKIPKLPDLYKLELGKYMYKHSNKTLPTNLIDIFTPHSSHHEYNTRNRNNPRIPLAKSTAASNSLSHTGPSLWSKLPTEIRSVNSFKVFKKKYKDFMIAKYSGIY